MGCSELSDGSVRPSAAEAGLREAETSRAPMYELQKRGRAGNRACAGVGICLRRGSNTAAWQDA